MSKWDWHIEVTDYRTLGGWLHYRWELSDKSGEVVASGWAMTRLGARFAGWVRKVWWSLS